MTFKTMNYEKKDGIGIITLNRPESMNAINSEFMMELDGNLDDITADNEVFVVIITGGKKFFAAGADIKEVLGLKTPIEAHRFVTGAQSLFSKIDNLEKPVIAAIGGLALGGGCELALACDIRIGAGNALLGQPEIKIGVIPGGGGTQRLPRLIGMGRAKELLYTGDPVNADEAYRIGLLNKVVPIESLMDEAKKMARKIAAQPGVALQTTKRVVNEGIGMNIQSALAHEALCFEYLFATEDQKEGMKAFVEKRKPVFKGK